MTATETATSFYNERQRVEIDLIKSLAIDEAYGIGKERRLSMIKADNNPKGANTMSEITYSRQGDYLIPDLTLPTEPELPLGRYALMHRDYLEKHKRVTYLNLLTSGRLNGHLHEVEQTALQRLELLTKQLSAEQGVTEELNFKRKADMFTKRTIKPHREVTSVETASEALALSIGEKARVDLPYMEQLTGKTQAELVQDLQGVIFKVPNCEPVSYVAADEYLSGNVRNKLTVAELAAKNDPELAVNVDALKKVIPKDLSAAEISVRLGATWIPQEDIQRFVMELLTPSSYVAGRLKVRYTPINGDWFIENKSSDMGNVKADSTYGTKRASAYRIIEDTLNLRDTRIFDYVYDEHSNKKAVFNAKETTAAQAKQEVIKQAFQDWIWKDPERRNRLVRYYNDTFNSVRPREYDGSHITFGGISPEITLRPHQVNAIAHILYGGSTLLAHKVGAGKTFEMVAAAQESNSTRSIPK